MANASFRPTGKDLNFYLKPMLPIVIVLCNLASLFFLYYRNNQGRLFARFGFAATVQLLPPHIFRREMIYISQRGKAGSHVALLSQIFLPQGHFL